MKKCPKCNLVFEDKEDSRCSSCGSLLFAIDKVNESGIGGIGEAEDSLFDQVLKDHSTKGSGRVPSLLSAYFHRTNYHFLYFIYRQEYKMGKGFKRFLVKPFNVASFFLLPWAIYNILDSFFIKMTHSGFCEKCHFKYKQVSANQPHDADDCDYNREFSAILDDINSGRISIKEVSWRRSGERKVAAGHKSAFHDLATGEHLLPGFVDVIYIIVSLVLYSYFVVQYCLPHILDFLRDARARIS